MRSSAARAVGRWSLRLLRREWRSQVLVVALIAGAVGAAVLTSVAATQVTPSRAAEVGSADHRIEARVEDPSALGPYLDEARAWFGTVDVVRHASAVVPGAARPVELRAHEAGGAYSGGMVAVRSGRRPETPGEVAVTDQVGERTGVAVGDRLELAGTVRRVVGVVEDPADLDDEFALVVPAALPAPDAVTLLVRADPERVQAFRPTVEPGPGLAQPRGHDEGTTAALVVLVVATVALLLVSLVAGAAFVTVAHRRRRQLGLLAAVGATDRHLRTAMLAHGLGVGVVAGAAGTATALVVWLVGAGAIEGPAGHRIDRLAVPLWLVGAGPALALVTAIAAAWWPARAVARLPVVAALSERPPEPRPARRSLLAGAALAGLGLAGITLGIDPAADEATPILVVPGILALGAAAVLLAGPALRGTARLATRLPIGVRLPVRDLARAEGRAAAALGAVSLALGIAVAVVLLAAAATPGADGGNLSPRQVAVWTAPADAGRLEVPALDADDLAPLDAAVARIAAEVATGADVVPLDVATDGGRPGRAGGTTRVGVAMLGRPVGGGTLRDTGRIYVATPALLRSLGVDPATIDPDTLLLTTQAGPVHVTGELPGNPFLGEPVPAGQVQRLAVPDHTSAPRTLITEAGLAATGLTARRAGWLVEADHPVDAAALGRARSLAADAGLSVEGRDGDAGLAAVATGATVLGAGLALGIVALTLGLLRSEAARDTRTLAAVGASRRTHRLIRASTAGLLSGLGVVIGGTLAAGAVVAGYWGDGGALSHLPVAHLAALVLGLPVAAALLGEVRGSG